ncbi:hypothetical protein QNI19_29030 [Cytophagaceae bacterium DM2B3-1]|uniref:Uncharacterized protein n=2 Tax=Xanthocytophaga flava TaxID=3048013 RepID=A0ABT7CU39_9BACT|nr:hypothetical protein [Xanthocytophaga flavus]
MSIEKMSMDYYDIYMTGASSSFSHKTEFVVPFLNVNRKLVNGFLGLHLESEIAYTVCKKMQESGLRCVIVPIAYKLSTLTIDVGRLKALEEFRKQFSIPYIPITQIYSSTESVLTWRFGYSLQTSDDEKSSFVLVDKSDGHIWTKKESSTQIATEYYLELKTSLSKQEIEDIVLMIASDLNFSIYQKGKIIEIDNLDIQVREVNYGSLIQQKVGFVSNIRVDFCLPKYKKGYHAGIQSMLPVMKQLLTAKVSNAILFSNFDDFNYIFVKQEAQIFVNDKWNHWSREELAYFLTI